MERVFPSDATVTDVINLLVASGLEPGTFEITLGDRILTEWDYQSGNYKLLDLKLTDLGESETFTMNVGHSLYYIERRLGH